jgi:hypothetical protein
VRASNVAEDEFGEANSSGRRNPTPSGAGYPEEQPSEVDDTGSRDPEQDPSGGDEERAPDNDDGTATGG